jgi:hypothetical protein
MTREPLKARHGTSSYGLPVRACVAEPGDRARRCSESAHSTAARISGSGISPGCGLIDATVPHFLRSIALRLTMSSQQW